MNNNGFDYVDLGLPSGTLWATCNVGANSPEEYGKYFAWGETEGYYDNDEHNFYWSDYKYGNAKGTEETKYNRQDWLEELELNDDAAHVNMGGDWKMPTYVQMKELFNDTNHVWVSDYQDTGIAGRVFTSKTNGNTMFIPASGDRWNTSVGGQGDSADLWSSTLVPYYLNNGVLSYFDSDSFYVSYGFRYFGYCVRGVLNKTDNIKSDVK